MGYEIWRCDPESSVVSRIIHPGEVEEFKIKLAEAGQVQACGSPYKEVSVESVGAHCEAIDDVKSVKHAESDDFDVVAKPQMNLGVYIQVPFCQTKCTYCNFHTGVVAREKYEPYAAAVCREISTFASGADVGALRSAIVDSVYFGGGTPSLLEPAALAEILDSLRWKFASSRTSWQGEAQQDR